jgi:hypothetical protein
VSPFDIAGIDIAAAGERPVRISVEQSSKALFFIDLYGDNMWGLHDIWLPPVPGLKHLVYASRRPVNRAGHYACVQPEMPTESDLLASYFAHFPYCMHRGGVIGYRVTFRFTPDELAPGLYTFWFDGQPVQFILETGAAQRPMRLEAKACNVLEEIDGPTPGLVFRRAAPPG